MSQKQTDQTNQTNLFGLGDLTPEQILDNIQTADEVKLAVPQRLAELYDIHIEALKQQGILGQQAHNIAVSQMIAIGNHFGGISFYMPHNRGLKQYLQAMEIYKDFNGNNIAELVKKYRLSHQSIYNAINSQRKARQHKLF